MNRPRKPLRFSWIFPAIFETAQIFWRCTYKLRRGRCRSQPFATKERYGCGSAACRYTSARQNAPYFTGIFGEFVTSQWADRVVGPYGKASTAHVSRRGGRLCPPAGYTGFTAIFGEFATSQRADVGIGPYKGAPWAQGADSPYQGEMARRAKRGRDAGPKGLSGFEHNKFSSTLISAADPLRHFLRK